MKEQAIQHLLAKNRECRQLLTIGLLALCRVPAELFMGISQRKNSGGAADRY